MFYAHEKTQKHLNCFEMLYYFCPEVVSEREEHTVLSVNSEIHRQKSPVFQHRQPIHNTSENPAGTALFLSEIKAAPYPTNPPEGIDRPDTKYLPEKQPHHADSICRPETFAASISMKAANGKMNLGHVFASGAKNPCRQRYRLQLKRFRKIAAAI